jgi:N-acyl-D-aspartate/D-glutamate deacylase
VTRRFVERSHTALNELVLAPVAQHVVFRDVAAWDGLSENVRCHTSVEVRDGLVVAVRDLSEELPAGAVVFDGAGKTLIPGLIDMHRARQGG